ncbi:hypothetical protein [Nocardia fluminea]|uniref:hypothetical protein n=1 Tax=Nocardia fluminea TaxID=134984 RepID=UPI0033DB9083
MTPQIDLEDLARAWVGEQVVVLQWWLGADPRPMTLEEVTGMLRDLSLRGRYRASGFDDDVDTK